ncbi:MAG: DUF5672 family protein [Minisyncoccota bacterium]
MKTLSICIPTYEMKGYGQEFLRYSFDILLKQTFTDFDVVVSDHSENNEIENLCKEYSKVLDIHYFKNTKGRGSSSANINNAIKKATGILIKILFQDDFLYGPHALQEIAAAFDVEKDRWLVTGCEHSKDGVTFNRPFYPRYHEKIHIGKNTISSPSVLTIKNDAPLLFDENIIWYMDTDYYKRCFDRFGEPKILNKIGVVNRIGKHQVSNTLANNKLRERERVYVFKKYNIKTLADVTLVAVSSIKVAATIRALEISMRGMKYHEVILVSPTPPTHKLNKNIHFKRCPPIPDKNAYSKFMLYDLARYIESDFALVVQYDGYVIHPEKWNDKFLEYDYIGAPWKKNLYFTAKGENVRVGNGGFSLRSKKLLDAFNRLKLPFSDKGTGYYNEDGAISVYYRNELTEYGIRYAPVGVASRFSHEATCNDSDPNPFGFHANKKIVPPFLYAKFLFRKIFRKV